MKKIDISSVSQNVFSAIGRQWMLLTAGDREGLNTMTVSWGGMGVLWGKNVVTVYVRPQRYTYEFMERGDYFTVAFFGEDRHQDLALCGSKSGRDVDKVKECGFTPAFAAGDAPYFAEAKLVFVCRKLYFDDIEPAHFLTGDIDAQNYPAKDYHRMYIGEIVEVLEA